MASRPNKRLVVAARVRGRVIMMFGFLMLQRRQKKSEFEIDPNSLVDFDVTDGRSVSEWQKERGSVVFIHTSLQRGANSKRVCSQPFPRLSNWKLLKQFVRFRRAENTSLKRRVNETDY